MTYGHFDDEHRAYVITDPLPPRAWINYLGNRRLTAFISQNAGGLLWYRDPQHRRITRYHYVAAPADRPGFYVYVKNRQTGTLWNPHFAPTGTPLDRYECRQEPGITAFVGEKEGIRAEVTYSIPPDADVFLWEVTLTNLGTTPAELLVASYIEFGLLEFMREIIGWTYLKNQIGFRYHAATRSIRYDYHVFEAPFAPRMAFGCSTEVAGWDYSRDAFLGRAGSLERPAALTTGAFTNSELPLGGHGCGALGVNVALAPGATRNFSYRFAIADPSDTADAVAVGRDRRARRGSLETARPAVAPYQAASTVDPWGAVDALLTQPVELAATRAFWAERLEVLQVQTGDAVVDRFINTWAPYNNAITLELARIISTDHMGLDGLRYRDTTQDALGVANFDPAFAAARMRLVFATQHPDGGGCFSFHPEARQTTISDQPHRSDNTVWQVATVKNLIAETGEIGFLEEIIPFRDSERATVYEHIQRGLQHIEQRRGPRGLPVLFHADWNDNLALFGDERAESVMLGMQLVYACQEFAGLAARLDRAADEQWCRRVATELSGILNSDLVWDGRWYRRLLLTNGKHLGGAVCRQGRIFLEPQAWAVISGVGDFAGRGRVAMDAVAEHLALPCGLALFAPPFTGIPEPEDPPMGSSPGTNENGGVFCHANTWAIIAEAMLGNADRAWQYYRQLLPPVVAETVGAARYGREPYVFASTFVGPVVGRLGEGGISWLTGTVSWMQIAATQYLLGIRPTLEGLEVTPCLPAHIRHATAHRRFRGETYHIEIDNTVRPARVTMGVA